MANLERNNKILLDLVRQPGNNVCADCGAPGEYTPHFLIRTLELFNLSTIHIFPTIIAPDFCVIQSVVLI